MPFTNSTLPVALDGHALTFPRLLLLNLLWHGLSLLFCSQLIHHEDKKMSYPECRSCEQQNLTAYRDLMKNMEVTKLRNITLNAGILLSKTKQCAFLHCYYFKSISRHSQLSNARLSTTEGSDPNFTKRRPSADLCSWSSSFCLHSTYAMDLQFMPIPQCTEGWTVRSNHIWIEYMQFCCRRLNTEEKPRQENKSIILKFSSLWNKKLLQKAVVSSGIALETPSETVMMGLGRAEWK